MGIIEKAIKLRINMQCVNIRKGSNVTIQRGEYKGVSGVVERVTFNEETGLFDYLIKSKQKKKKIKVSSAQLYKTKDVI